MAKTNLITHFQKLLLQFITEQDPLLAMLQWMTEQLMQMEAEAIGAGVDPGGAGGVHQRSIDEEDKTVREVDVI